MKKTNLAKNTLLISLGTVLTKGISFIMIPFFSRWLSTSDYGSFDLFTTYVTMFIPILSLSTGDGIFRFGVEEKTVEGKAEHITNGLYILLAGLLMILVGGTTVYVAFNWGYALPFCLMLAGELINKYLQSFLRAIKKLNIYSFCSAISTLFIFASVTLFVKILDMGLAGMIYGYAFGYLFGDLTIILWTKWWIYLCKNYSWRGIKKLISYSLPLIPNSISWWIINVSDRTIINVFLGAATNGIYAIACKIPNLCSSVFSAFNISWQEAATEIVGDDEQNIYFNSVYNTMYITLISICWGILSCNFILFNWIFDERYYIAHLYSPLLVTSVIFSSMSVFFGGIQISFKQTQSNGMTTMVGAIVNIIVHLALVKVIGLHAAVVSTLVSNMVVTWLRQYLLRKRVVLHICKKNWLYTVFYLYIMVCAYFKMPLIWDLVNLMAACVMFLVVNKKYAQKIFLKVKRKNG